MTPKTISTCWLFGKIFFQKKQFFNTKPLQVMKKNKKQCDRFNESIVYQRWKNFNPTEPCSLFFYIMAHAGSNKIYLLLFWFWSLSAAAAIPQWCKVSESGTLRFNQNIPGFITFRPANWAGGTRQGGESIQAASGYPRKESGNWTLIGKFKTVSGVFDYKQIMSWENSNIIQGKWTLKSSKAIDTGLISLKLELPVGQTAALPVQYDDKQIILPEKISSGESYYIIHKKNVKKLCLPLGDFNLELSGNFQFSLIDARKMFGNWANYIVQIYLNPSQGALTNVSLEMTMTRKSLEGASARKPYVVSQASGWKELDFQCKVEPGSILDFSGMALDAPAGKYGPVVIRDGHMVFKGRPREPQRFLGINLCFKANYPTKEEAERLTEELATLGYNAVRFHLYDSLLTNSMNDPEYLTLNKELLDRNDYFFHCLKQRGFYISTDLYSLRRQKIGDKTLLHNPVKMKILLDESYMKNLECFAKKFFSHVNPYTGLARKDDPALMSICFINEDSFRFILPKSIPASNPVRQCFNQAFSKWKAQQPAGKKEPERFVESVMLNAYFRLSKFLRALGCNALFTDQNCHNQLALTVIRNHFDYVDNHNYWDHPIYPEKKYHYPLAYRNASGVGMAWGGSISDIMPTRIFGKPFSVSEYNFCFPNPFRAEAGMVYGAYASLQDWDALFRYNYSERYPRIGLNGSGISYNLREDPIQILSEKIIALLFLRRDVQSSKLKLPILVRPDVAWRLSFDRKYPNYLKLLGLMGQIGSVVAYPDKYKSAVPYLDSEKNEKLDKILPKIKALPECGQGELDLTQRLARSSTGEIQQNGKAGTMTVVTLRTEAVLRNDRGEIKGKYLKVYNHDNFALVSASAMDGQALAESGRILFFHLTNSCYTGTTFTNRTMCWLIAPGKFPALVRRGVADIRLRLGGSRKARLYALGLDGRRRREIPVTVNSEGELCFTFDTHAAEFATVAYELAREKALHGTMGKSNAETTLQN